MNRNCFSSDVALRCSCLCHYHEYCRCQVWLSLYLFLLIYLRSVRSFLPYGSLTCICVYKFWYDVVHPCFCWDGNTLKLMQCNNWVSCKFNDFENVKLKCNKRQGSNWSWGRMAKWKFLASSTFMGKINFRNFRHRVKTCWSRFCDSSTWFLGKGWMAREILNIKLNQVSKGFLELLKFL